MNYYNSGFFLFLLLLVFSCNHSKTKNNTNKSIKTVETSIIDTSKANNDSIVFSFSFIGCNRADRSDRHMWESTANEPVLERIFDSIANAKRQDELFFFLGDLVLGETNTYKLGRQLKAWVDLYNKSSLKQTKIQLIAIPGNHELLTYVDSLDAEFPLVGSTDVWLKYMDKYMPTDREIAPDTDSLDNRLTFSFTRRNIGFIVMNTDSFYPYPYPKKVIDNGYGLAESRVPTDWITKKIAHFQSVDSIDHIFVLGHKPHYIGSKVAHGHDGIVGGTKIWDAMNNSDKTHAMLSAHVHEYIRSQPITNGPYQVVAGNGGSTMPDFFGYSTINIYEDNRVELITKGFDVDTPYYRTSAKDSMKVRDHVFFTR